jgi:alanyl-tRNA synthetase
MKSSEVRRKFVEFFEGKDHAAMRGSSLIPLNDATLLFTNAGMVQFKSVFLGEQERSAPRAVTVQKCVRAGGKHNDLENVGHTARHHTFFEMLGNFSFGDYFKRDAIIWAWEFLTEVMKLPKDKLWVTVFLDDDEAAALWRDVAGVSPDRIVRLGEKDNFWSMGDTGPCGPCSEILIDQGPEVGCGRPDCAVGCDCDRYLELWNLVFMQFNRDASGVMTPLPKPSIDTGMGLERLSAVMQNQHSNFHSDLFTPVLAAIGKLCGKTYGDNETDDISMRVIADHIRSTTFLLADGLLPANEGRGYVLRRIIRRAARYGKMLGIEEPFMHRLVDALIGVMGESYPELNDSPERIRQILRIEEERFANTLKHGLSVLEDVIAGVKKDGGSVIPGAELFRLYDTFGFPLDLVGDIAGDQGLTIDEDGFRREMDAQKTRARASWVGAEEAVSQVYRELSGSIAKTEFTGYDSMSGVATVLAIVKNGERVNSVGEGERAEIFLDRTPAYAESGGQAGDTGGMKSDGATCRIVDTKKPVAGLFAHHVEVSRGEIVQGAAVTVAVDENSRAATMRHHTATHLLQAALRDVLGEHVKQAGSMVSSDRLRFDFTHFTQPSRDELEKIENWVNASVLEIHSVSKVEMPIDEAVAAGAMALFGEKYGDTVRVVSAGEVSRELCGGTHVDATGEIGLFKILSESSVASGVRRIEAVAGLAAIAHARARDAELDEIAELLKTKDGMADRLRKFIDDARTAEKELEAMKARAAVSKTDAILSGARDMAA